MVDTGDTNQSNDQIANSPVANPISGAITYGLGTAATVSIGAVIRKNRVHDEAMTILIGGVICGVIFGIVGLSMEMFAPSKFKAVDGILQCGALFSSPAMGYFVRQYSSYKYTEVVIDMFVGGCVASGGLFCCVFVVLYAVGVFAGRGGTTVIATAIDSTQYVRNLNEPEVEASIVVSTIDNSDVVLTVPVIDVESTSSEDDVDAVATEVTAR